MILNLNLILLLIIISIHYKLKLNSFNKVNLDIKSLINYD